MSAGPSRFPERACPRRAVTILAGLAAAVAGSACETRTATANEAEEPTEHVIPRKPMREKPPAAGSETLAPLVRADKRMAFPARGATNLGYNLATLEKMRALAAAVEIPEWSAPHSGNARALRDDDIATAWTCRGTREASCAAGLHFPEPAKVRAVRLFGAAATGPGSYAAHPRVKKLRIHTDEGWAEAVVPDEPTHGYVVFGKEVTTRSLVIEVLGTYGDNEDQADIHLGEIEAYGSAGVAREPWDIDPARSVVRVLGEPWSAADRRQRSGETYVALLDEHGASSLLMRGTAFYGRAGDRMLLVEVLDDTTCEHHRGQFFLVDQHTRVIAPIGDLGGIGANVYRSQAGLGFAHGSIRDDEAQLAGVLLEGDSYERRRTQRRSTSTAAETFAEWKLDDEALPRGGEAINRPLEGCELGDDHSVGVLARVTGLPAPEKPGEWMVCPLGEHASAFVTDHGPCGASWEIVVIADEHRIVAQKSGKRKGSRAQLRRAAADAFLVEIGGDDDATEVFRVDRAAIVGPVPATSLALAAPDACRKRCDDPLVRGD